MPQKTKLPKTKLPKTKLTVRVDGNALDRAKDYAAAHNTSLSRLETETPPTRTPILDNLTGILPAEATVEDHRAYLAKSARSS